MKKSGKSIFLIKSMELKFAGFVVIPAKTCNQKFTQGSVNVEDKFSHKILFKKPR